MLSKTIAIVIFLFALTACNNSISKQASKASSRNELVTSTKAKSKKPAVILFYAQWCGYCKQMFPLFQELQAKYQKDVNFFYIDIDSEKGKELALQYRTKQNGVPDTQFYNKEGKLMEEFLGASSIERIESNIKNLL
jgi:thiol-disulfide isomerase/thioredoxin